MHANHTPVPNPTSVEPARSHQLRTLRSLASHRLASVVPMVLVAVAALLASPSYESTATRRRAQNLDEMFHGLKACVGMVDGGPNLVVARLVLAAAVAVTVAIVALRTRRS
jgi:hypothetical protein